MSHAACERCIFHVRPYPFLFEMPQNRRLSFSAPLSISRSHVFFSLKCPDFLCSIFLKCPIFPIFKMRQEKWGISKNSNIKNRDISRNQHVINFQRENQPKIKLFDFGAFQIKMHMASREKYIFHMLFGAFYITPRILVISGSLFQAVEKRILELKLNLF